jgi:hypothetical protein
MARNLQKIRTFRIENSSAELRESTRRTRDQETSARGSLRERCRAAFGVVMDRVAWGAHRSMSDSFSVKIKSETLQVAQSHDGCFAADRLERRDVEIIAHAARGDHRDSA